jgi:hypothetical protein
LFTKVWGAASPPIREVFDRTAGKTLPASPASETEPQTVTFEWRRHDDECAT